MNKLHNISINSNTPEIRASLEESGYKLLGSTVGSRIIASRSGTYICGNSGTHHNPRYKPGYHNFGNHVPNFLATAHLMIKGY